MYQAPDIPSGGKQSARKEKSKSRAIEKVGSEKVGTGETGEKVETGGGQRKMAAGGTKKEEKVRLSLKEEYIIYLF